MLLEQKHICDVCENKCYDREIRLVAGCGSRHRGVRYTSNVPFKKPSPTDNSSIDLSFTTRTSDRKEPNKPHSCVTEALRAG